MKKLLPRKRAATKIRRKIGELRMLRLTVYKTPKHIYAQIFTSYGEQVLVAASSVEKAVRDKVRNKDLGNGKIPVAVEIGTLIAKRAKDKGIVKVAFDRSGFKYHGRIKALADSAREHGLEF